MSTERKKQAETVNAYLPTNLTLIKYQLFNKAAKNKELGDVEHSQTFTELSVFKHESRVCM